MKNWALLFLALTMSVSSIARAQTEGFAINRFDVSERGSEWFVGESLDLRGDMRWAAGLVLDYAHKPLVLYDAQGDEEAAIVGSQLYAHLGGSLVLIDRVRVAVNLPIALVTDGESGSLGAISVSSDSGASLGDLRLGGDVRLLGEYGDLITLAAGLQLYLPTGSRESFSGDGAVRVTPRVMAAGQVSDFAYSARLAVNIRAQDDAVGGVPTGTELFFAATAGMYVLDRKLLVGPELSGSTVLVNGGAFEQATTPFEVLFGGHYTFGDFRAGLGVGPGLTQGLGAPAFRLVGSFEWVPGIEEPIDVPEPEPTDRDGDDVLDVDDACPDEPGVKSPEASKNGCPLPADRDGDGVLDADDACPDEPGVASDDPKKNGCPAPADRDGDGVLDADDACPDHAGPKHKDPARNGCPDSDGDKIVDPKDACPATAGPENADPQKNGCPKARVESGQIKIIERVEFASNSSKLLPSSDEILTAVLEVLNAHPEITKVSVNGHTDNVGGAAYNKSLSQRRAKAVAQWLVKHGVAKKHVTSHGFGLEQPLDSNDTEAGRQRNRRVEFQIMELDGQPIQGE